MASRNAPAPSWHRAAPAPIVLVSGPEDLLAERAIQLITQSVADDGQPPARTNLDAGTYSTGQLLVAASPSLFDEPGLIVVDGAEAMSEAFLADALSYVAHPDPDVVVVVRHRGGVRGKRLLDAMRASGVPQYTCPAIARDNERVEFVAGEFRHASRTASARAVRALVDAVGGDVAELASACAQLVSDVEGEIDERAVARYYGTRVNATGYAVADAAVAGNAGEAIALARHAMATGTDAVPLVAALAMKLRTLAKVGAARGRGLDPARDLGMQPWQVDRARRELAKWTADSLSAAIQAVAQADADVKGGSRSPHFALERAVRSVAELADAPR